MGTLGRGRRCELIPEYGGIGLQPQSAASNDQIYIGPGPLCLLGAAVVLVPIFAPPLEAREAVALAKADRLEVLPVARSCSQQVWPRFDTTCLRAADSGATIREARLVTASR